MTRSEIESGFTQLQANICEALEAIDGVATFSKENWEREQGGGGLTRVIQDGGVFEKGGVNFSAVNGPLPDTMKKYLQVEDNTFFATGVSIVIHPRNPHVPIIHMNVRYFEMESGRYWFGGGIDLTPIYVVEELAQGFHAKLKQTCDQFDASYYPEFKKWADDYFFIKHRNETRGVGGIFFDRLSGNTPEEKKKLHEFVLAVGNTFVPVYQTIVKAGRDKEYTDAEKSWQSVRRGRYVEFNLVYDKGTRFGLDTGGRTESILMSLPPIANWHYNLEPTPGSPEGHTTSLLRKGIDWALPEKG